MMVTSLEQMEEIVKKNRELFWDGWTVVQSYPNKVGWRYPNGALVRNRWHVQKRFEPTEAGWNIPRKYLGQNG